MIKRTLEHEGIIQIDWFKCEVNFIYQWKPQSQGNEFTLDYPQFDNKFFDELKELQKKYDVVSLKSDHYSLFSWTSD